MESIIKRHRPKGFRIRFSRHRKTSGKASFERKVIYCPHVTGPETLQIYLHECAHVHLKHKDEPLLHKIEFEAEMWAIAIMRLEGIPVPQSVLVAAREYVSRCIHSDEAKGLPIETHIRRWAQC